MTTTWIDAEDILARHEASLEDRGMGSPRNSPDEANGNGTTTTTATTTMVPSLPSKEVLQAHRRRRKRFLEECAVCRCQLELHQDEWGYDSSTGSSTTRRRNCVETFQFRQIRNTTPRTMHSSSQISEASHAERRRVVLCFAAALDGLDQRHSAIMLLESYLRNCHLNVYLDDDYDDDDNHTFINTDIDAGEDDDRAEDEDAREDDGNDEDRPHGKHKRHLDVPVTLALAKLYFKGNDKQNAMQLCLQILHHIRADAHDSATIPDTCDIDDAADAYHLAGWVYIHSDDHTSAYRIWNEGALRIPSCRALQTHAKKRLCWDAQNPDEIDFISESTEPRVFKSTDLIPASVTPCLISKCPALALFPTTTQQNQLVFVTKYPILSSLECARVLQHVHAHHDQHCHGIWSTVRHSSVPTTDVAVEDIPSLRPWLRNLLQFRLYPMLCTAFPYLRNKMNKEQEHESSTTTTTTTKMDQGLLRVHDAFIVRYDADHDMSVSLPEHSDTSLISFTVALNQRGRDFEGGGTWFESISWNSSTTTTAATTSTPPPTNQPPQNPPVTQLSLQPPGTAPAALATSTNCKNYRNVGGGGDDDDDSGGGCVVDADEGHAVAFAGPLRHAGYPITSACRIILVLFLYAQDYAYGPYLEEHVKQQKMTRKQDTKKGNVGVNDNDNDDDKKDMRESDNNRDCNPENQATTRPSGDSPGGFVVYNQTVELVNMLNRQVASILDE